jgi:hypothetical protein
MIKKNDLKKIYCYDIETYPNLFAIGFKELDTGIRKTFTIWSNPDNREDFINQIEELTNFLLYNVKRVIGYNNFAFDDVLVNFLLFERERLKGGDPLRICDELKQLANKAIIIQNAKGTGFEQLIRKYKKFTYINSTDLMMLFNTIERISLKQMGVNLKWPNIIDLPYHESSYLDREQMHKVLEYLDNDVDITEAVFINQKDEIQLRAAMTMRMKIPLLNSCRTDIAKEVLMHYLVKETGKSRKQIKKGRTFYDKIALKDCVIPKIKLITKEGKQLLKVIENTVIDPNIIESKGKKKKQFEFIYKSKYVSHTIGLGGIHSNNPSEILKETENFIYLDIDVNSYYPYLMVNEQFYPKQIGHAFIPIYNNNILIPRMEAKRLSKTDSRYAIDADTLKIVANGTFGLTKSIHSFLYDPKVTIQTCLNGELLLIMLLEWIEAYTKALIVYSNTDGLTIRIPIMEYQKVLNICKRWEAYTNLGLEYTEYSKLVMLNVNNYLIVLKNGSVKVKGSAFNNKIAISKGYEYPILSAALYDYYVYNIPVDETILKCKDIYMFMKSQRTDIKTFDVILKDRASKVHLLQKTNRWVVTKNNPLEGKIYARAKEDNALVELQRGYYVTIVNHVDALEFEKYHIDYDFYINQCLGIINTIKSKHVESHTEQMAEQLTLQL